LFAKFNGRDAASNGGLGFGWTKATGEFNPFNGGGTGVVTADHVLVGVARTAGNGFSLAAENGTMGAMNTNSNFGNTVALLTNGNWYRLEGTILFDAATKTFTFSSISLDDFGSAGTAEVTPNILSGTGKTVTAPTFGTTGRTVFITNNDRGFQVTDNYTAVPEPGTAALLVAGLGMTMLRRRRA
jgi:hypothetical protein